MSKPEWWHHLLAWSYAITVMLLTYALALEGYGAVTMAGPILVAVIGVIMLYGGRVEYIHIGEKIKLGIDNSNKQEQEAVLEIHEDNE